MILIPFSAGLDSTMLLHQAIQKKENFETCYIQINNNKNKTLIENQQRKKIIKAFNEKFKTYFNDNKGIEIMVWKNKIVSLPQVPVWLCGLIYQVESNTSEVRIGYCMNDDAISYVSELKKAWRSYAPFCHEKLPKLSFPLMKISKRESKRALPDDIFQLTYFCEDPQLVKEVEEEYSWSDCGCCGSCKRAIYDETFYSYTRNQKGAAKFSSSEIAPASEMVKLDCELKSAESE
jgi:7-cyano-7-deazaguanine synthase in queuosine biosynthesis